MARLVLVVFLVFASGCSLRMQEESGWDRSVEFMWDVHNDGGYGGRIEGEFENGWTYAIHVRPGD